MKGQSLIKSDAIKTSTVINVFRGKKRSSNEIKARERNFFEEYLSELFYLVTEYNILNQPLKSNKYGFYSKAVFPIRYSEDKRR